MIVETWEGFIQIMMLAAAFFCAGWLWRHESAEREHERREAIRRANRLRRENVAGR